MTTFLQRWNAAPAYVTMRGQPCPSGDTHQWRDVEGDRRGYNLARCQKCGQEASYDSSD